MRVSASVERIRARRRMLRLARRGELPVPEPRGNWKPGQHADERQLRLDFMVDGSPPTPEEVASKVGDESWATLHALWLEQGIRTAPSSCRCSTCTRVQP